MGNLSEIFLGVLVFTLSLMLVFVFFVRDVKITLDKKIGSYEAKYLSPVYKNKEDKLDEIQNVVIISEVSTSSGKKQAGKQSIHKYHNTTHIRLTPILNYLSLTLSKM